MRLLSLLAAACFALVAVPALASITPPTTDVPEPATLGLLGLGVVALLVSRRR